MIRYWTPHVAEEDARPPIRRVIEFVWDDGMLSPPITLGSHIVGTINHLGRRERWVYDAPGSGRMTLCDGMRYLVEIDDRYEPTWWRTTDVGLFAYRQATGQSLSLVSTAPKNEGEEL